MATLAAASGALALSHLLLSPQRKQEIEAQVDMREAAGGGGGGCCALLSAACDPLAPRTSSSRAPSSKASTWLQTRHLPDLIPTPADNDDDDDPLMRKSQVRGTLNAAPLYSAQEGNIWVDLNGCFHFGRSHLDSRNCIIAI